MKSWNIHTWIQQGWSRKVSFFCFWHERVSLFWCTCKIINNFIFKKEQLPSYGYAQCYNVLWVGIWTLVLFLTFASYVLYFRKTKSAFVVFCMWYPFLQFRLKKYHVSSDKVLVSYHLYRKLFFSLPFFWFVIQNQQIFKIWKFENLKYNMYAIKYGMCARKYGPLGH